MPVEIATLMEGKSELVCIGQSNTVRRALAIMFENDYSQLPVVNDEGDLLGIISEQTIMQASHLLDGKFNLLDSLVDQCRIHARTLTPEHDIFDAIGVLNEASAVVIVGGQQPTGILTTYDIMHFLRDRFEDLIRIEDIEIILRQFTDRVLPDENTRDVALIAAFGADTQNQPRKRLDHLTFGEQVSFMTHPQNWPRFGGTLEPQPLFQALMDGVRQVRNQLAHFRGLATQAQDTTLRYALDWLSARPKPPMQSKVEPATIVINTTANLTVRAPSSYPGKYGPLRSWLENYGGTDLQLLVSFPTLEQIIDSPLPPTAFEHRSWWANDASPGGHSQSKAWLLAGWRVVDVDFDSQQVTFRRLSNVEAADVAALSELDGSASTSKAEGENT